MPHAKYECTALSQSKVISILEVEYNYETDNSKLNNQYLLIK